MKKLVNLGLCAVCSQLNLSRGDFENPPFEPEGRYGSIVVVGTLEALRLKQLECKLCRLILRALRQNQRGMRDLDTIVGSTKWEVIWRQSTDEYEPHGDCKEEWYGSALYPSLCDVRDCRSDYSIQLVDEIDTTNFLRGRDVLPYVNVPLISSWLVRCEAEHGSDCSSPPFWIVEPSKDILGSLFVIDVRRKCVVTLPSNARYATLSYVWGQSAWARTDTSNLERFKQPGTISPTAVPRTVVDSMGVVAALGYQYLWVDFLCIEQTPTAKQQAIQSMDAIFGHAYLCIVAASGGDAESGLSGWSSDSRYKYSDGSSELITDNLRLGVLQVIDTEMLVCEHAQRAWTYQEGILPARRLVFLNGLVHYACRSAIWREDIHAEVGNLAKPSSYSADVFGRQPETIPLQRFSRYISAYTDRKLTFAADVLNAFVGIQNAVSETMNRTKLYFGMPASAFDWALLWSAGRGVKLERRIGFPSTSWMGWSGYTVMAATLFSEMDQAWLQGRTWIDWYIFNELGRCVILWDPERDATLRNGIVVNEEDILGRTSAEAGNDDAEGDLEKFQEDEDTENSDSAEEIETSAEFPQYGWPTPGNSYGRFLSSHDLPPRDLTKQFTPKLDAPTGTLYFVTVTATFALCVRTPGLIDRESHFALEDKGGQFCGVVWDDGLISTTDRSEKLLFDILVLSEAGQGTTSPFEALEIVDESVYSRQQIHSEDHTWNMYNVMLVSRVKEADSNARVYERRGIGVLYKNALSNAWSDGASWHEVYLL